jgi:DNA-binding MarR family transcriptional regulator
MKLADVRGRGSEGTGDRMSSPLAGLHQPLVDLAVCDRRWLRSAPSPRSTESILLRAIPGQGGVRGLFSSISGCAPTASEIERCSPSVRLAHTWRGKIYWSNLIAEEIVSQPGLLALLHRANQVASERLADALANSEVTARQVQVLVAIEAKEGATQTNIVDLTGIDRSTMADIMRRLQNNKLIERRRTKGDARAYAVKLTQAGRLVLAVGKPALGSVEKSLLSKLTAAERADLLTLLGQVVASVEHAATREGRT